MREKNGAPMIGSPATQTFFHIKKAAEKITGKNAFLG